MSRVFTFGMPLASAISRLSRSLLSVLPVSGFMSSSLELESRSPLEIIVVVILFEEGLIFGQTGLGLVGRCGCSLVAGAGAVALVGVAFVVDTGGRWMGRVLCSLEVVGCCCGVILFGAIERGGRA